MASLDKANYLWIALESNYNYAQEKIMLKKANAEDFHGRYREILSDPLNLLIDRCPTAGYVDDTNYVCLHNGLTVPISGDHAYYGDFSTVLILNRGVHEPLEEYVFQEVIDIMPQSPRMLELGAYWGHYSMWLKLKRPEAFVQLVESDAANLQVGQLNFQHNKLDGHFLQAFVGNGKFEVDQYFHDNNIQKLNILHSDIQGYEVEMLHSCTHALTHRKIDFLLISTHSQALHYDCIDILKGFNYRVEVEADFEYGTTSYDGFVFASSPAVKPCFNGFKPMTRIEINNAKPSDLVKYISTV